MADVYHPTLYVLFPKASGFPEALRCGRKTRTTRNWKTATAYRYLRWLRAECRGETHWFAARTNWSSASQFGWVTITAWSRQKPEDITPFEKPKRWMGQNTFPILLLNDDNMIEEH